MLVQLASMRDAYAEVLLELGAEDARVVVLGADTSVSIKTSLFGDRYPERFFNVGIAEANMMGIAAGLALAGKTPFVTTYAGQMPRPDSQRNRLSQSQCEDSLIPWRIDGRARRCFASNDRRCSNDEIYPANARCRPC